MTDAWTADEAAAPLRAPTPSDDKYSRGVIGIRTGSQEYPGAAALGVEAAWRTGVGMVRYLGPERPSGLVLARRPETVVVDGRVQAWLIGSGTSAATRDAAETARLRTILAGTQPVIVDAGALDLVPGATAPLIVTPHDREHARLREVLGLSRHDAEPDDEARAAHAASTAAAGGAVVLLKGSTTIVATPSGWARSVTAPTAWLATAGTGDVLAGILGALVAGAVARHEAMPEDAVSAASGPIDTEWLGPLAATAAWVHGHAAARAADAAGGPITALDVAEAVPPVVGALLRARV